MSRCTIIIPVHNRRETTLACLAHLRTIGDLGQFSVLVVDDGSSDGTTEAIAAKFPEVDVLEGDGNLWWTGATALGMQRAIASGAAAVCWLNDDCWPAPGTLSALLSAALDGPPKIVAPTCVQAGTNERVPNGFVGRSRVSAGETESVVAEGLSGFCVMVPRAVCDRIGFPDSRDFPHYFGDNAYTLAASRAGFECIVLGNVRAELVAFKSPPGLSITGESWRTNFQREFVSFKSPRRLRTLFAYQRMKYGMIFGTLLAGIRTLGWLTRFAWKSLQS